MNYSKNQLGKLKRRYLLQRTAELALLATGAGLAVYAVLNWWALPQWAAVLGALGLSLLIFILRYLRLGLHRLTERDVAAYLNAQFVSLQDSSDLFIAGPDDLSPLQQLQRNRMTGAFNEAVAAVKWPQQWPASLLILGAGLMLLFLLHRSPFSRQQPLIPAEDLPADSITTESTKPTPVALKSSRIVVTPPAYTGLKTTTASGFNLTVAEGSTIYWELQFSGRPEGVAMIFSDGDSTVLSFNKEAFSLRKTITHSDFYVVNWSDRSVVRSTDYYQLEVTPDQPPQIAIADQDQFVELAWKPEIKLPLTAALSDDYGLTEAYVIATVSKGNGESVKFREEKLAFVRPQHIAGRQLQAALELNTRSLGMEPGDELYYYVEAWDNRSPQRQSNRTETYFIQLQDTSTQMISFEGGLGVDLMPEYFRSQRQIIIDSEKLLAEKQQIDKKEFNSRSNELGYDQKVLRLRYGQFLGEEFESAMTAEETEHEEEEAPESEEEIVEQYGHAHDTENEHNLVAAPHAHEHRAGEEEEQSPIEAFAHRHDDTEEATFFIQSVKTKLRAALSLMWDAELHLRMFDPAASLPYQHRILKLLKEISNASRIYVRRVGFDPPPLKEDKRLSGSLEEVKSSRAAYSRSKADPYPAVRQVLPLMEKLLYGQEQLTEPGLQLLQVAGNELAGAAVEQPELYLADLSVLRRVMEGDPDPNHLRQIRQAFWRLLPEQPRAAGGSTRTGHPLQDAFILQLKDQGR